MQFSLQSATSQSAAFSVGFAFKQGAIPAGSGVAVSGATAQVVPKNTWPDGSLKFATVSGTTSLSAGTPLTVSLAAGTGVAGAALTTTNLRATGITASIGCGSFGTVSWSGSDWDNPFQLWAGGPTAWDSGPQMSSWIYRKPVGSDTSLVAWLEVRLFASGAVEVLPWIENGYLLVPGPTDKSATYTFTLGGTQRFSAAIDLPHHCRTVLINGPVTSYWLGTDPDLTVQHDPIYLQSTGLVPAYMGQTSFNADSVAALPSSYTPLQLGSFPSGMGSVGGNNYVGLLPEWDALYLTSLSTGTYKSVVFNAYSAGRYPNHYRDETTNRPARLSAYPTLTIKPPEPGWTTTPATSGTTPAFWSLDHQPSVGYLAYLVTGRWYHLETVQLVASCNALSVSYSTRQSGLGLFLSQYSGSTRQAAWTWRAMAHAATVSADADVTMQTEYVTQLANNITYYYNRYVGQASNTQGFIQPYSSYIANLNGGVAAGATTTSIPVNQPGLGYNGAAGDGQYVGFAITINGQTRTCTGYVSATNTLTVSPGFSTAPAAGATVIADDNIFWDAQWMQDYVTAVWGWTQDLKCPLGATVAGRMSALFTWKAQSIVGRLGAAGAGGFNYRDYAPYELPIAPSSNPDWDGGTGPWYPSWASIYSVLYSGHASDAGQPAPYLSNGPDTAGTLRNGSFGDVQGTSAEALPAIAYAVKYNVSGASAAYQRLATASNWTTLTSQFDAHPSWGIISGH